MRALTFLLSLSVGLALASRPATAQTEAAAKTEKSSTAAAGGIGVGIAVGHPSSLVLKKGLSKPSLAIQGGIGSGVLDGHGLHVYADFLWSPAVLTETAKHRVPFYVGVGARIYDHFYDRVSRYEEGRDMHIGLRIPVGIALELKETPVDFFAEIAPVADLVQTEGCTLENATNSFCAHDRRLEVHLALGGRYYFGR